MRSGTRQDIPALAVLLQACARSHRTWAGPDVPVPSLEEAELEWELRFARRGAWIGLVEEDGGRVVGVVAFAGAQVSREDRRALPGVAHVGAVFVAPDRWRRGIARMLLEAAEAAMRDAGFVRAQLWTLLGSPAERLYEAQGWKRDGRRERYLPLGLDAVAYVKRV